MFIGHFALGFAAKKVNTKPSLGTYFLAAQFLDLLWPTLLLLGIERVEIASDKPDGLPLIFTHYPISHSLLMVLVWAFVFGLVYWLLKKDKRAAIVLALCVVSHWFLDLVVHVPDLPLYPGNSPVLGFGLWRSVTMTLVVEMLLFIAGVLIYARATKANNKTGSFAFWGLVAFLFIVHLMNIFGDPPPSVKAIAWAGQLQWLIVLWGYWVDKNRISVQGS